VFACSKILADTVFQGDSRAKVKVLYCNVQVPAATIQDDAAGCFRLPDAVRIGTFSQVRSSKRLDDIVRAVATLTSLGRDVELVVAGGHIHPYAAELADLAMALGIEERVNLVGALSDPFPAMRACDIVVISSRYEAFGRVGVEAMLLGKPVVFAEPGGMSEYMIDGESGLAYCSGNAEELALQLDRLIASPDMRFAMGERGRAQALRLFGKDRFSGHAFRVMQEIRASGKAGGGMPKSIEGVIRKGGALSPQLLSSAHMRRNDPCPCGSGKRFKHCHGVQA
jgi:glycosyltransferase involved in cell wall biosynthesis